MLQWQSPPYQFPMLLFPYTVPQQSRRITGGNWGFRWGEYLKKNTPLLNWGYKWEWGFGLGEYSETLSSSKLGGYRWELGFWVWEILKIHKSFKLAKGFSPSPLLLLGFHPPPLAPRHFSHSPYQNKVLKLLIKH